MDPDNNIYQFKALLNAHENPKYNAIRNATFGLVFFGCPHRGAKGVELGNVAAKVARFISNGRASNDLLECLKHDSLFTRQMSNRFRHQLEDYHVVSFIESKPVQLGGSGPASVSHVRVPIQEPFKPSNGNDTYHPKKVIVDEESAVLGLTGLRETQLRLDADHSQMCKIPARGPMYRLIKGNIQQLVNQANLSMEGDVLPPAMYPAPSLHTPPQQPPTLEPLSSSSYPFQQEHPRSTSPYTSQQLQASTPTTVNVTGTMYPQDRTNSRPVQLPEHTNKESWDQVKRHEAQIFLEWSQNKCSKSWLDRHLKVVEQYKGMNHPETQATLELLGNMHMNSRDMLEATGCFSRLLNTIQDKNSPKAREVMFKIRTCMLLM